MAVEDMDVARGRGVLGVGREGKEYPMREAIKGEGECVTFHIRPKKPRNKSVKTPQRILREARKWVQEILATRKRFAWRDAK